MMPEAEAPVILHPVVDQRPDHVEGAFLPWGGSAATAAIAGIDHILRPGVADKPVRAPAGVEHEPMIGSQSGYVDSVGPSPAVT